jgi:transposase
MRRSAACDRVSATALEALALLPRQTGAPLDNNIVEKLLKRAVLHRNAPFYRTLNGAQVGDLYMSLIHTCQLCEANSFDYVIELQRHAQELAACPTKWGL